MYANTEVILNRVWTRNGFDAFVVVRDLEGNPCHAAGPLTLSPIEEDRAPAAPTFFLDRRAAQSLMNELYRAGLRPDDAAHVNDALGATREHIADLRKVAFALIDFIKDRRPTGPAAAPGPGH